MTVIRHHIVGPITDAFIRHGMAPAKGRPGYPLFQWAQTDRDNSVPRWHPLYQLTQEPTWDTTYALSRSALVWLWNRSFRMAPRCIIDIGGGRSTIMFGHFARLRQFTQGVTTKVVSIEHDPAWQSKTTAALHREGLDQFVRQLLIPLRSCSFQGRTGRTYDIQSSTLPSVLSLGEADLLLLDGPPGGDVGRHHALSATIPYLSTGANVFLDDIDRPRMAELLDHWLAENSCKLSLRGVFPFFCGFAWLTKVSRDQSDV